MITVTKHGLKLMKRMSKKRGANKLHKRYVELKRALMKRGKL